MAKKPIVKGIKMTDIDKIITDFGELSNEENKRSVGVILDCCHSGMTFGGDKGTTPDPSSIDFVTNAYEGLQGERGADVTPEGRLILVSSEATQKSREKEDCVHHTRKDPHYHGIFTSYIIEALEGKESRNGIITFNSLRSYLISKMNTERQNMKIKVEGDGSILDLPLVVEADKHKEYLTALRESVRKFNAQDIYSLFGCSKSLRELKGYFPEDEEIEKSIEHITNTLTTSSPNIEDWVTANSINFRTEITNINPRLLQLISNIGDFFVSIDTLVSANDLELCIIDYLWNLQYNPVSTDKKAFIRKCASCYRIFGKKQAIGGLKSSSSRSRERRLDV